MNHRTPATLPRCTVCGKLARVQVTELARAELSIRLSGAEPRCNEHGQVLATASR